MLINVASLDSIAVALLEIDDPAKSLQGINEDLLVCQQLFLVPGQQKKVFQVVGNPETLYSE